MVDLDTLDKLRERYGRIVEFDEKNDTFYEVIKGERKQVRIEPSVEESKPKSFIEMLNELNAVYEARLTPADRDLRLIIIEQVSDAVSKQLVKEGHMTLRYGKYHSLHRGVCHMAWGKTKNILKDKYNINWASPRDENPDIMYD